MKKMFVLSILLGLCLISSVQAYDYSDWFYLDSDSVDMKFCAGSGVHDYGIGVDNDGWKIIEIIAIDNGGGFLFTWGPGIEIWPFDKGFLRFETREDLAIGSYDGVAKFDWFAYPFHGPYPDPGPNPAPDDETTERGTFEIPLHVEVIGCSTPPPEPVPEFPSGLFPIIAIIGFLGFALIIRKI